MKELTESEINIVKLLYSRGIGVDKIRSRFKIGRDRVLSIVRKTEKGERGFVTLEKKAANGGRTSQFQFARLHTVGNKWTEPRDKNTVRNCCNAWIKSRGLNWECRFDRLSKTDTLVTRIA